MPAKKSSSAKKSGAKTARPAKRSKPAPAKPASPAAASSAIDQQLKQYRSMRDFGITAEPSGSKAEAAPSTEDLPFVIQKHAATRLHYDFRLGWRGVLKSWAVAKGPSYYTGDKRLAVQVEDHPIEYGGFEGTIPKGQYGGGTVMLWDHGTWKPHGDADEGLRTGRLKFELHGEKLKGNWTLVRMGGKAASESKPNWLLIKEHDEYERPEDAKPITEEKPDSVVTGRGLDRIGSDEDHVWNSKDTRTIDDETPAPVTKPAKTTTKEKTGKKKVAAADTKSHASAAPHLSSALKHLPREPLPDFIPPQLTIQTREAPRGEGWVHELKLDGYRIQVRIDKKGKDVKLYTRNGLDWTRRMTAVAEAASRLPVTSALLDGEVVVLDENGGTSFAALQAAFQDHAPHPMTYFAFDLLHLDGHDLRREPLLARKELLAKILPRESDATLRYSEHFEQQGSDVFANACRLGAEGIVSKRTDAPYTSGRSASWIKIKCVRQQEFVVGGFTLPGDKGDGLGALLLGYYEGGKLIYAGRTGTGFTHKSARELRQRLEKMKVPSPPYASVPAEGRKGANWVRPGLVAEVAFATWTADKLVRQASFKGLREDKSAKEVVREQPVATEEVEDQSGEPAATPKNPAASHATSAKAAAKSQPAPQREAAQPGPEHASIRLTHPGKIIDAASGLTKRQLADYYAAVTETMMPHLASRPLSLVRCPEGVGHPCFFQKHIGQGLPEGIGSVKIRDKKGGPPEDYVTLAAPEGLPGLAQMGVLEIHPWGSRNDALETPDMLIFDLDPDEAIAWETLTAAAQNVRRRLRKLGLESFVKTTGGKGLHVVAPIVPEHDWTVIKNFAHAFAAQIEKSDPDLYLIKMTKAARKGKIFLDYLRNERGATAVAPFSPRARPGVHVALPLSWTGLKTRPACTVANFDEWKHRLKRDPWARMWELKQKLSAEAIKSVA
jgi:bifunctional non-homologous end joining protein LigD